MQLRLDEAEHIAVGGLTWLPLRRALGATAFGLNAYAASEPGAELIEPHDETSSGAAGHEELYFVVSGRARFTLRDQSVDAPAGTFVLARVGEQRAAVAEEPDTVVLVVGGLPGAAMPPSAFEHWYAAEPFYRAGDYQRAIEVASAGLADWPEHPLLHYQLACYCSLAGRLDEATEHLGKAFEGDARTRDWAAEDDDLVAIRDRLE